MKKVGITNQFGNFKNIQSTSMKIIDNTPIENFDTDWGDPDGTGMKEKSKEQVQKFIKKKFIRLGYTFLGIATPTTTPVTITNEDKFLYIATEEGDYTNFGLSSIAEMSVIKSVNGSWVKEGLGVTYTLFTGEGFNPGLYVSELYIENFPKGKYIDIRRNKAGNMFIIASGTIFAYARDVQENNVVYPITVYQSSDENYPINTIVGYIMFKDVEGFTSLDSYFISNNGAYQSYARNLSNSPMIQKYLLGISVVEQNVNDIRQSVNAVEQRTDAIEQSVNAVDKVYVKDTEVWKLNNDTDWFTGTYSYGIIALYTKKMTSKTEFDQVRINGIAQIPGNTQYKLYKVSLCSWGRREAPIAAISDATHTLLQEGTMPYYSQGDFREHILKLESPITLVPGEQVMCCFYGSQYGSSFQGGSNVLGNPEETSNVVLYNTGDPFEGNPWNQGALSNNKGYFNVALTLLHSPNVLSTENAEKLIVETVPNLIKPQIKLTIPDTVYAAVGTELNIWNDTISLSVDDGLHSPKNYHVEWNCNKGLITQRGYRFQPVASDVGGHQCKCTIYDLSNTVIDEKTFTIEVLSNNISSKKNIVYFGDSLGRSAAEELWDNFNDSNKFSGQIPNMLGTRGYTTDYHYEAVGGYGWDDYATKGNTAYRVNVSGINSLSVGASYILNNTYTLTIREVNITDGSGNLLIENTYGAAVPNFPTSGSLIKSSGAGDDTITYTNGIQEPNNPLWNNDTNSLDVTLYKERIGLSPSDKIDAVSFQFGINDNALANKLGTLRTYISDLYSAFVQDNPNCKFIVGLTTSAGNTVNGAGINYGASKNVLAYLQNVATLRQYYCDISKEFPNMLICPAHLMLDRYYGYGFSSRAISQRVSTTEQYHNNHVHPTKSGYGQIADAYLATYIKALS